MTADSFSTFSTRAPFLTVTAITPSTIASYKPEITAARYTATTTTK